MKFLCDRCKTRYSIGDERVRGKILKIRCKNCANVITVREGMPSPEALEAAEAAASGPAPVASAQPRRAHKTTTQAPVIQSEAPASPGALAAAFATAMKPPPALEEEWYVSIDGDQSGPFSLTEAQRWVAAKAHDADLYCWSEGFDDWLPVDKVSHFRGLRKKPAPAPAPIAAAPPPLPRVPSGGVRAPAPGHASAPVAAAAAAAAPVEPEPKPLFAATMAALEKGSGPSDLRNLSGAPAAAATPAPVRSSSALSDLRNLPGAPASAATPAPVRSSSALSDLRNLPGAPASAAAAAKPANGLPHPNGAAVVAKSKHAAFDASDSQTQIPSSSSSSSPTPVPAPAARPAPGDLFGDGAGFDPPQATPVGASPATAATVPNFEDDDLEFGEVSRVVKLTDLVAGATPPRKPQPTPRPAPLATQRNPLITTGRNQALVRTGPVPRIADAGLAAGTDPAALVVGEPGAPPAAVHAPVSHHRGMIALMVGSLILLGAAGAVVFFVLNRDEAADPRLGKVDEIDTTRPDEVRRAGSNAEATAPATPPGDPATNPLVPRPPPKRITPALPSGGSATPALESGRLEAREIEEMATRNSSTTQRCFMRAQRGADGILLADVKKISVTLTINGDGSVADAQLSDNHGADTLGRCLISAIRTWRFRPSPGGTFKFVLHFG